MGSLQTIRQAPKSKESRDKHLSSYPLNNCYLQFGFSIQAFFCVQSCWVGGWQEWCYWGPGDPVRAGEVGEGPPGTVTLT